MILPFIPFKCPTPYFTVVAMVTRGGSADVRVSYKDSSAGTGSGDICCWASTPENKMATPPVQYVSLGLCKFALVIKQNRNATCALLISNVPFVFI